MVERRSAGGSNRPPQGPRPGESGSRPRIAPLHGPLTGAPPEPNATNSVVRPNRPDQTYRPAGDNAGPEPRQPTASRPAEPKTNGRGQFAPKPAEKQIAARPQSQNASSATTKVKPPGQTKGVIRRGKSPASAPVVPPQSVAGRALILVVAIMGFLACLSFGVLTLIDSAARDWQLDVSREVTIQVKPVDGVAMEPTLQRAMSIARETSGVAAVRLVSDRESARLLEPWLGAGLDLSGLPLPRLVVLELSDPASADMRGLRQRLSTEVRGAVLDDHSIWSQRLRTMASAMVFAGFAVLVLVLVAMALSVVFATRAAMAGNRDVIEVLHFVGAEDAFIAREFQRHFLILGLKGGIGGGVAAMISFAVADWVTRGAQANAVSDQAQALFGGFSIGLTGYFGIIAIIVLVASLTAATSRLTVRGYLSQVD
jgi:cell division transport system permease protein